MNLRWIPLIIFLVSLDAFAAQPRPEQRILIIANPKLWAAPDPRASVRHLDYQPGKRLTVLDTKNNKSAGASPSDTWYKIEHSPAPGWMPDAYLAPPPQELTSDALGVIGAEPVDRYHGIPPEYKPDDLVSVGPLFDKQIPCRLRKEAAQALERMIAAARRDGVRLEVVSGYRSWITQQGLYEKRVRESGLGEKTVAKPGHSEHQLGTTADLTDGHEETLLKESFGKTTAGRWLHDHAWAYGFAISFTRHNQSQTGCAPEPWHYRYWGIAQAQRKHIEALGE